MTEILLKLRESTSIDLPGKATSGYEWSFTADQAGILLITHSYFVPAKLQAGGTGTERFFLTAIAPGTCALHFRQTRSWEKEKEPLDTREYMVTVIHGQMN
jgi:predicted secreted protein